MKYREVGSISDTKLLDIYMVDNNGNLLNGTVCQYSYYKLVMRVHARNGKQEGVGRAWHENGKLKWECAYSHGVTDGISKYYFESGELDKILISQKGKVISAKCSNGYIWTNAEVAKWNAGNQDRDSVRNICE